MGSPARTQAPLHFWACHAPSPQAGACVRPPDTDTADPARLPPSCINSVPCTNAPRLLVQGPGPQPEQRSLPNRTLSASHQPPVCGHWVLSRGWFSARNLFPPQLRLHECPCAREPCALTALRQAARTQLHRLPACQGAGLPALSPARVRLPQVTAGQAPRASRRALWTRGSRC